MNTAGSLHNKNFFSFWQGFFQVFGLGKSKLSGIEKKLDYRSDAQALNSDWINVQTDIRKVYEEEVKKIEINAH